MLILLVLTLLAPAQADLIPRQDSTAVNFSIPPTTYYLSTPYPVALRPGLDCSVFSPF
jgi:hypothetical protein